MKGNAHFTGVAPADRTGAKFLSRLPNGIKFWLLFHRGETGLSFLFNWGAIATV